MYGSISKESYSPTSEKKQRRKKRKSKGTDSNSSDPGQDDESSSFFGYKKKITDIEQNLLGKSIDEDMGESIMSKIIPTVKGFFYKLVKPAEKKLKEEIKENISKVTSSQFLDVESLKKNDKLRVNEGAKATNVESLLKNNEGKKLSVDIEQSKENISKNKTEVIESISTVDKSKSLDNLISFSETQDDQNEVNKTRGVQKKDEIFTSVILDEPREVNVTSSAGVNTLKEVTGSKVIMSNANDQVEKLIEKGAISQSKNYESVNETKPKEFEEKSKVGILNKLETIKTGLVDNTENNLKNTISGIANITTKMIEDETLNKSIDIIKSPIEDVKTKINESKLKFLGLNVEKVDESKIRETELTDDSYISDESKVKNDDDDSVEIIEEIIYVDDLGDDDEEEIIEETIETTTIESSPETTDEFNFDNSQKGHTKTVTIRKTSVRKISSSTGPGEVKTTVETIVSDDLPENEKQKSGLHFGIGKSGVNVGLGEKKLKIGTSGVKFGKSVEQGSAERDEFAIDFDKTGLKLNRNKNKTSNDSTEEIDASGGQNVTVPEKAAKKSKSMKMFKRSTSQPMEPDIQEIESGSEATSSKKLTRSASSLLKFGKSRSKSSVVLDANKIPTTDVKVMSDFIDHERRSSRTSQVDLSDYGETGEIKSTSTLEEKGRALIAGEIGASASGLTNLVKTVKKTGSLTDLGAGSSSNEKLNKRIKSKSKRDIKEKSPPIWKF